MIKNHGEIKSLYVLQQGKIEALSSETMHVFPVSRWIIYQISVPAFIAISFFSTFFFSNFSFCFYSAGLFLASGFGDYDENCVSPCKQRIWRGVLCS